MDDLHVIGAARVESVVSEGAPIVAPRIERSDEKRRDDSSLLLDEEFQRVFVVQMRLRVYREVSGAFLQQAVIPILQKYLYFKRRQEGFISTYKYRVVLNKRSSSINLIALKSIVKIKR